MTLGSLFARQTPLPAVLSLWPLFSHFVDKYLGHLSVEAMQDLQDMGNADTKVMQGTVEDTGPGIRGSGQGFLKEGLQIVPVRAGWAEEAEKVSRERELQVQRCGNR